MTIQEKIDFELKEILKPNGILQKTIEYSPKRLSEKSLEKVRP